VALHPRCVVPPLAATGLVDDPDRAQGVARDVRDDGTEVLLEGVASRSPIPAGGDQELLEGAHRSPGIECHRLDALARQVRQ